MIPKHAGRKRNLLRRVLWLLAMLAYAAAVASGVAAWLVRETQSQPVIGSLMASIVFFAGVGIVLHVLANASLPDLRLKR